GRVTADNSLPIQGMLLHNGRAGAGYRWTFTDSDGAYTLADIAPGSYDNRAFLYGYRTAPLAFFNPVTITDSDAVGLDHLAFAIPKVSVTVQYDANENGENAGSFIVTRTGDMSSDLAVPYTLSGRARAGQDYRPADT